MDEVEKKELELLEKIDNYLNGNLIENERSTFESALENNPEFANEVELNRVVNETIKNRKVLSLKKEILKTLNLVNHLNEQMKADCSESETTETPKEASGPILRDADPIEESKPSDVPTHDRWFLTRKTLLLAASVFIFLAVVFIIFIIQPGPSTPDSLVAAYLEEPYHSPPFYRGSEVKAGYWGISYEMRNYQEARTALKAIAESDAASPEALFYLGLCYLYQDNPDPQSAISQFKKVLYSDNRYREQALWYLGLAYYLVDEQGLSIQTLRNITGFKQKDANTLLEKMK